MVSKSIIRLSTPVENLTTNSSTITNGLPIALTSNSITSPEPLQVATALCFVAGVWQLIMYALRLGVVSSLLSDTLVSGFTTAAAIHVITSQIKDLLGIRIKPISGYFEVIFVSFSKR